MTAQASRPDLPPCDLVMKGGATSGVVYPPVIVELASKYRFANIGGTSAGAIAAVVTAAAEYGRQRGHLADFTPLSELSDEMSRRGHLLTLFRSSAPGHLRPLLDTLLPLVSDPGAAAGQPIVAKGGAELPGLLRWAAPELLQVIAPAQPGQPAPDDRLGQQVRALLGSIDDTHPQAYQAGLEAGGQAGVRVGQILIGAAVALALLFAIPLLLAGAPLLAWVAWAALAAALVVAAFLGSRAVGRGLASAGGVASALGDLARLLLQEVPRNLYGICTGRRQPEVPASEPALIDWLTEWVNRMAGPTDHGRPLTFADLEHQGIGLRVVTTNLSHGRPYVLPFDSDLTLLIQRGDAEQLFPPEIVDYLADPRHTYPGWSLDGLNAGLPEHDPRRFLMLPNSLDLPVVVAMRMSLSFPLLISAVRLYTVSGDCPVVSSIYRPEPRHVQPNWFSDGGICSNFPIHFFDQWLPSHPTFGINLTGMPIEAFSEGPAAKSAGAPPSIQPGFVSQITPKAPMTPIVPATEEDPETFLRDALLGVKSAAPEQPAGERPQSAGSRVFLPDAEQPLNPLWQPIDGLTRFLWMMFDTAMNYRDTTQLMLPSYKERAVQIRLDGTREGGLNLNMPEETVAKLQRYGHEAGTLLRDRFDFDRHRWVRFRVLMGELERQLLSLDLPLSTLADAAAPDDGHDSLTLYERLMRSARAEDYPFGDVADPAWVLAATARLRALRALIGAWREANRDDSSEDARRRADDLTRMLLAITNTWRRGDISPEESDRRTATLLKLIEGWERKSAAPPRSTGREARFFKQVSSSGMELRVTPEL